MAWSHVEHPKELWEEFAQKDGCPFRFYYTDWTTIVVQKVETEEAVLGEPGAEEGFASFEEGGEPGGADVGIERLEHVIDHPEDGLTGFGLTKIITLGCVVHLFNR